MGGSYDDYYDYIICSYLLKEKAEDHLNKLISAQEKIEADAQKCASCLINHLTKRKYNNKKNVISDYCNKAEIEFDGNDIMCKTYYNIVYQPERECQYKLVEVDVIE